jgi:WD40-like Beta Propeller Repeat
MKTGTHRLRWLLGLTAVGAILLTMAWLLGRSRQTVTPPPTVTSPVPGPETPPVPGKAVTLYEGDIWLVGNDQVPIALTSVGDVSAIFGWNWDGTKLLFGRGRNDLPGDIGDTTELYLFDVALRQQTRLTTTNLVRAAGWSPVDDRVAYCEHGDILTVATLDGMVLHQRDSVLCTFTWSPDGSSIAVAFYTPDMITEVGDKYSTLAIWQLSDGGWRQFGDATHVADIWPVWSMDGQRILFQRYYYDPGQQAGSGWYVADMDSGETHHLEGAPASAEEIRRSPRADMIAYRVGPDLYVMDFEGQIAWMGHGHGPVWAPDGKTLFYRGTDNRFQVVVIETEVGEHAVGGAWPSPGLYIEPEYFAPGE